MVFGGNLALALPDINGDSRHVFPRRLVLLSVRARDNIVAIKLLINSIASSLDTQREWKHILHNKPFPIWVDWCYNRLYHIGWLDSCWLICIFTKSFYQVLLLFFFLLSFALFLSPLHLLVKWHNLRVLVADKAGHHCRAIRHALICVQHIVWRSFEVSLEPITHPGYPGGATDEQDLSDFLLRDTGILYRLLERRLKFLEDFHGKLFELGALNRDLQISVLVERGQSDRRIERH